MSTALRARPREEHAVASIIEHGRRDPVVFIESVLGAKLWQAQKDIARAVFQHPRVAVKACHSSGKTYSAAYITLAYFYLFPNAKILTTAPTWTQVERLLWGTLRTAHQRLPKSMGGQLFMTELRAGPEWWAIGLSTDEGVKFQGHHGDHVLIIVDEAPGVRPDIYEAIEGIRAGGNVHVLLLGNPTLAGGAFYDAFTEHRASWQTFTISAFDTPNLSGLTADALQALSDDELDVAPYPYLTTRRWVWEKWREWGPGHPLWQSRVLGEFPEQSPDALLSLAWLLAAKAKPAVDDGGAVTAGIDVAGPGESETVLCLRAGGSVLRLVAWANPDPRGELVAELRPWMPRLNTVNVDADGIGYYLGQHLADLGFPVQQVHVGVPAHDGERYANRKAEYYWGLRMRLAEGDLAGLTDDAAIAQLAGIRWSSNARGQTVIESKDAARKRGVKSPDRAEAIMLAFGGPAALEFW